MNIDIKRKISIIGIGSVSTLLILLMIETAFAQLISDFLIGNISDNLMLLLIVSGLFLFTIIISVIVGIFIVKETTKKSVLKATIMSLLCLILFLFSISNGTLFIYHRGVYNNIHGFELLPVFPQVLIYFSVLILGDVFNLFILIIIVYYIFYVVFLEKLYKFKFKEVKNHE